MPAVRWGTGAAEYVDNSLSTASPARLVVMLYDRLVLDLERAEGAIGSAEPAGPHLLHAQDIVMELLSSLDVTAWDGASRLAGIYTFLYTELVRANVARDADGVAACLGLVVPLRDAWRDAALATTAPVDHDAVDTHVRGGLETAIA